MLNLRKGPDWPALLLPPRLLSSEGVKKTLDFVGALL